jgi:hypothetical protein
MTTTHAETEGDILAAVKRLRRTSLFATGIVTVVLCLAIGGFFAFGAMKLSELNTQLTDEITKHKAELSKITKRLDGARSRLGDIEARLREASNMRRHLRDQRPILYAKALSMRYHRAGQLYTALHALVTDDAHWGYDNTMAGGFTSPGYATFILQNITHGPVAIDKFPIRSGLPHPGDLVRYPTGYAMFYFPAAEGDREFVRGMTPFGVASLDPNFARILKVQITPFSEKCGAQPEPSC